MPAINSDNLDALTPITDRIIGAAMKVHTTLGPGFLEKVYENSLSIELQKSGLLAEQQRALAVYYQGILVGQYVADIVVENQILIELKATRAIEDVHKAQLLSYLKTTGLKLGLILNFGAASLQIKRMAR